LANIGPVPLSPADSRLALFASGVSAMGLPFGLLPVSSAIAEEPAKQGRSSNFDKAIADYNEAIRLDPQDVEYTKLRNQALQQKKELKEQRKLLKQQKEKPEPISWWTVFAFALLGFLFVGTGIPLILEKVAPNPWYGFRVQATLENPAVWYPANRYLGKCLLGFGLFVIVTAVGLSFVPDINPGVYFFSCAGPWSLDRTSCSSCVSYSFNPSLHCTSLVGTFPPNEGANCFISVCQECRDAPNLKTRFKAPIYNKFLRLRH
jgi:SdpI/YfhL protein family